METKKPTELCFHPLEFYNGQGLHHSIGVEFGKEVLLHMLFSISTFALILTPQYHSKISYLVSSAVPSLLPSISTTSTLVFLLLVLFIYFYK